MTLAARLLTLRVELRDEAAAAEVSPERLSEYLAATGWQHERDMRSWHVWTLDAGRIISIFRARTDTDGIPWANYGRRMLEAIQTLAAAEGRSPLAIWCDLVGLTDATAAALASLDTALAGMVSRPEMYARTPEALLLQALLALEIRALLRGEPEPSKAYDDARARRRIPVSQHACDRLTLAGVAALVGEVAGMPSPAPDVALGEAPAAPEGVVPADAVTEPSMGRQERLPGFSEGTPPRRSTRHVFGGFEAREYPSGPLASDATVRALTRTCRHCLCLHRVTSSGPRLGAEDFYSENGVDWRRVSPACVRKERS